MASDAPAVASVSLHDTVAFLSRPDAYRRYPSTIEVRETHLSFVFLSPTDVYKMKKPIAHAYGDLRNLDARGINCRAEVQLDRRLAPAVYLGVVAVTQETEGALALRFGTGGRMAGAHATAAGGSDTTRPALRTYARLHSEGSVATSCDRRRSIARQTA